jgi:hypothetical protein
MTAAIAEIVGKSRRSSLDPISAKSMNDALDQLTKSQEKITSGLKLLGDYNRETYKDNLRSLVINNMDAAGATAAAIKKKLAELNPKMPFYAELAEEIINEDFKSDEALRVAAFKRLDAAGDKAKKKSGPPPVRPLLIDAANTIGSAGAVLQECLGKIQENSEILLQGKKGFWAAVRKIFRSSSSAEKIIYEIEYTDEKKGMLVKETLNFTAFCADIDKKLKILSAMAVNGGAAAKLEKMPEEQLEEIVKRNIRDVYTFHKLLGALDEYFKNTVSKDLRTKIKGIKPELSGLKNATANGNQKLHFYMDKKQEIEQFKAMGIITDN